MLSYAVQPSCSQRTIIILDHIPYRQTQLKQLNIYLGCPNLTILVVAVVGTTLHSIDISFKVILILLNNEENGVSVVYWKNTYHIILIKLQINQHFYNVRKCNTLTTTITKTLYPLPVTCLLQLAVINYGTSNYQLVGVYLLTG